jgi:hypothetical protein
LISVVPILLVDRHQHPLVPHMRAQSLEKSLPLLAAALFPELVEYLRHAIPHRRIVRMLVAKDCNTAN